MRAERLRARPGRWARPPPGRRAAGTPSPSSRPSRPWSSRASKSSSSMGAARHLIIPASLGAVAAGVTVALAALVLRRPLASVPENALKFAVGVLLGSFGAFWIGEGLRSEEHTSELQSPCNLVCRLLLEKKKYKQQSQYVMPC